MDPFIFQLYRVACVEPGIGSGTVATVVEIAFKDQAAHSAACFEECGDVNYKMFIFKVHGLKVVATNDRELDAFSGSLFRSNEKIPCILPFSHIHSSSTVKDATQIRHIKRMVFVAAGGRVCINHQEFDQFNVTHMQELNRLKELYNVACITF